MEFPHRFISAEERRFMSPSSSPEGSPYSEAMDSSPLSSPSTEPLDLSDHPILHTPGPAHPYAGSTNATRRPPMYEMKAGREYNMKHPRAQSPDALAFSSDEETSPAPKKRYIEPIELFPAEVTVEDQWETWWKDVVDEAVDAGLGHLDLTDCNIQYIPPEIGDLGGLGIVPHRGPNASRVLSRSKTAPAVLSFSSPKGTPQSRGSTDKGLQLFLYNNAIVTLPLELFKLQNLTVLSLRNNGLEHLPPQIAELRALKDLNVSRNRLSSLPAEMTAMTLERLIVHPNEFKRYEGPPRPVGATDWRAVSETTSISRLPSLQEITLRYLLSPAQEPTSTSAPNSPSRVRTMQNSAMRRRQPPKTRAPSNLEKYFMLPIPETDIPPWAVNLLDRSKPGAVSKPRGSSRAASSSSLFSSSAPASSIHATPSRTPQTAEQAVGRCPSPLHCDPAHAGVAIPDTDWVQHGPPFVTHVEERYTWRTMLAGIAVGQDDIGVPLLWRGCEWGCLAFLSPPETGGQDVIESGEVGRGQAHEDEDVDMGT